MSRSSRHEASATPPPSEWKDPMEIYHPSNLLFDYHENIYGYRPGGWHPVSLGDNFHDGRYTVHHKLGYGDSSTVWLAKDNRCTRWVALKITRAEMTKGCPQPREESPEPSILQALAKRCPAGLSSKYIIQLLDGFLHEGPNGTHQCLVFELLGPTLANIVNLYHHEPRHQGEILHDSDKLNDWEEPPMREEPIELDNPNEPGEPSALESPHEPEEPREPEEALEFEPETIIKFSTQILQGVNWLHEMGYTYGDLSVHNIAFTTSRLWYMSEEDLFAIIGRPETDDLVRLDGQPLSPSLPRQLINVVSWDEWIDEDEEDIRIFDFSESFVQGVEPDRKAQSSDLQAPETIFSDTFDYRLDLWQAGMVIYAMIGGNPRCPFTPIAGPEYLVPQMINFLGEDLPSEWEPKFNEMIAKSNRDYGEDGEELRKRYYHPSQAEERINKREDKEALRPVLDVMKGLVKFRPSDRISALQALDILRENSTKPENVKVSHNNVELTHKRERDNLIEDVDIPSAKRTKIGSFGIGEPKL